MLSRKLSNRELIILVVCFLMAGAYAVVYGVIKPVREEKAQLEDEIKVAQRKLRKNYKIIAEGERAAKQYEQYLEPFKQKLSDEEEMSRLLSSIEAVGGSIDVRLTDMKPQKVKEKDFYKVISVSVSVDGEFAKLIEFMHILQSSPYYYDIDELRFDRTNVNNIFNLEELREKVPKRATQIKGYLVLSKIIIPE